MTAVHTVASAKPRPSGARPTSRSAAQRLGSDALAVVMDAWEQLTDEERDVWRMRAASLRLDGVTYFKQVNLRRLRRGQDWLRLPPQPQARNPGPTLKRLIIHNRRGRLHLELELLRPPVGPTTVWGALPCNRGLANPHKCPRLDWLPISEDGRCDITHPYYAKHGHYLQTHSRSLAGQRIFIRTRLELDYGTALFEQVQAVVPEPQGLARKPKKANSFESPSKALRKPFEDPS